MRFFPAALALSLIPALPAQEVASPEVPVSASEEASAEALPAPVTAEPFAAPAEPIEPLLIDMDLPDPEAVAAPEPDLTAPEPEPTATGERAQAMPQARPVVPPATARAESPPPALSPLTLVALIVAVCALLFAFLSVRRTRAWALDQMGMYEANLRKQLEKQSKYLTLQSENLHSRIHGELDGMRHEVAERLEGIDRLILQSEEHLRTEMGDRLDGEREATRGEIAQAAERLKGDVQSARDELGVRLDEEAGQIRADLTSAEGRLQRQMDEDRQFVTAHLEAQTREREDTRNQRRIETVVTRFEEPEVAGRAGEIAESEVVDLARLRLAGVADLRTDVECFHTVGRLFQRGHLEGVDQGLLRRILGVGMLSFFRALDGNGNLTRAQVEEALARLEAERGAERDLLEWLDGEQLPRLPEGTEPVSPEPSESPDETL